VPNRFKGRELANGGVKRLAQPFSRSRTIGDDGSATTQFRFECRGRSSSGFDSLAARRRGFDQGPLSRAPQIISLLRAEIIRACIF
jgi:hypothetical protein